MSVRPMKLWVAKNKHRLEQLSKWSKWKESCGEKIFLTDSVSIIQVQKPFLKSLVDF